MKRIILIAVSCIVLLSVSAAALELESLLGLGNVAFDTADTSSLSAVEKDFPARLHGYGLTAVSDRLNDMVDFRAGFERDPILRNTIFTHIGFASDYLHLTVGPFFGPFNAEGSILSAGLSAKLRFEVAGIAFTSLRADSSLGAGLSAPGDNVQERKEITVGFWAPNTLVSFRISSKTFTLRESRTMDIADDRTRYEFLADVYKKNEPYTASVNIGYQTLSRSYIGDADTDEDALGSAIVGFGLSVQATPTLRVSAGTEAALYSWGIGDLGSPSANTALFTVQLGVSLSLPSLGLIARRVETP